MFACNHFDTYLICWCLLVRVCRGDFIPDRTCAKFYSNSDFNGDTFLMKDFDQSVNPKVDYRSLINGWWRTGSISVENDCKATVCDKTYFEGNCLTLNAGNYSKENQLLSPIFSANCTCIRECKCSDVFVSYPFFHNHEYGRAFLKDGCNKCDSEYISLPQSGSNIRVLDIVIPEHYKLQIAAEGWSSIFPGPVVKNITKQISTFEIHCNSLMYERFGTSNEYCFGYDLDNDFFTKQRARNQLINVEKIHLPEEENSLMEQVYSNTSIKNHPGILALKTSLENRRSPKMVYIIVLLNCEYYSYASVIVTTLNYILRLHSCTIDVEKLRKGMERTADWNSVVTKIIQCDVPVEVPVLGIESVQIRVVLVPILYSSAENGMEYRGVASLEKYLDAQPDLQNRIPNLILVQSKLETESGEMTTEFHRTVKALTLIRHRMINEEYSNIMFVLDNYSNFNPPLRNPEKILRKIATTLQNQYSLPKPINILPSVYFAWHDNAPNRIKVNGNFRTAANEYFPKNFRQAIIVLTRNGGDTFGSAVLQTYFDNLPEKDEEEIRKFDMVQANDTKAMQYKKLSDNVVYFKNTAQIQSSYQSSRQAFERLESNQRIPSQNQNDLLIRIKELENNLADVQKRIENELEKHKVEVQEYMNRVKKDLAKVLA